MATRVTDEFGSRANPPDASYPDGSLKNETTPGVSNDGSPLDERVGNDWEGFKQAALSEGGITPNGQPDSVSNPQILEAVKGVISSKIASESDLVFDSVADMKAQSKVSASVIDSIDVQASTGGYFGGWAAVVEPMGNGDYLLTTLARVKAVRGASWVPDGYTDHYLTLGDGLTYVATLQYSGALNVALAGCVADDTERSEFFQAAVDRAALDESDIFIKTGSSRIVINKTINIPIGVGFKSSGNLSNIFVESGGAYTNNFAFLINTTDGDDQIVANANFKVGTIESLSIDSGDNLIKCFAFSGSAEFYNITTRFFAQSVKGSSQFNDHATLRRCNFGSNVVGADYQVQLDNLGDGCVLDQLQIANVGNDPLTPQRSVRINGCKAKITNCLYGDVFLTNMSNSTTIENCGMDGGRYIIERSTVSIKDSGISALPVGKFPITLGNDTDFTYKLEIDNVIIGHDIFRGAFEIGLYDIKLANDYVVDIRNMSRRVFNSNSPASSNQIGIRIEQENGSPFDAFNDYSHFYSTRCVIGDQKIVSGAIDIELPSATLNFFNNLALFGSDEWDGATGTYFYRTNVFWDLPRAVSRTDIGGEKSIALTNGGDAAVLEVSPGAYPPPMMVRVYRGTATGSYDSFADIPIIGVTSLVDNGNSISGIPWQSRASGPADASNALNLRGYSNTMGNAEIRSTAIPTAGTWQVNDKVIPQAAASGVTYYSCVTAGTPGTWKSAGNYEA